MLKHFNDDDKNLNSQIRIAISILKQQILNLNVFLIDLINKSFKKQKEIIVTIVNKLDNFLKSKIIFTMTFVKRKHFVKIAINQNENEIISINSRFRNINSIAFIFISFVSLFKQTIQQQIVRLSNSSIDEFSLKSRYRLSRNVHTIVDFQKE